MPEETLKSLNFRLMEPTFGCVIERLKVNKKEADKTTWGLRLKWFDAVGFQGTPAPAKPMA